MNRKGLTVGQFGGLALAFVVVAVILSVGGDILTQVREGQDNTTAGRTLSYNITSEGLDGMETLGEWLPTIAVIIAAAVVIGVITHYM